MRKAIYILVLCSFFKMTAQKEYVKTYFKNGTIKSEGWVQQNQKVDYWFFYFENGKTKEQGHYEANKKCKWWLFHNSKGEIVKKCEYINDLINGFSILYRNSQIIKAEKYDMGKKINEWNSLTDFKKDNKISF